MTSSYCVTMVCQVLPQAMGYNDEQNMQSCSQGACGQMPTLCHSRPANNGLLSKIPINDLQYLAMTLPSTCCLLSIPTPHPLSTLLKPVHGLLQDAPTSSLFHVLPSKHHQPADPLNAPLGSVCSWLKSPVHPPARAQIL